jgi:Mn-dependent DtxR family transcriptional regulator
MKANLNRLEPLAQSALLAVHEFAASDRAAHVGNVAARLGISLNEATRLLWALDAAGLIWAERCRLSMAGLSLAVQLAAQSRTTRRLAPTPNRAAPRSPRARSALRRAA